jgi:hypothetical protein
MRSKKTEIRSFEIITEWLSIICVIRLHLSNFFKYRKLMMWERWHLKKKEVGTLSSIAVSAKIQFRGSGWSFI